MMKRIFSVLCSVLIASVLLFGAVPAFAEGTIDSNITWNVDGTTLYLEGSGDMKLHYTYLPEIPWYEACINTVDTIVIGEGITSIDEGAFNAFHKLKTVQFPSTLTTIGPSAFLSCESLEQIVLTDRITTIGKGAFAGCESLKMISIPGNVYDISGDAFYNCSSVIIQGISGSYAAEYAAKYGIPFDGSRPLPADIMVTVNKTVLVFDQPPAIVNDRTLVPLRAIFEALGATVDWNAKTRTVKAKRGTDVLTLVVGTNVIHRNNTKIEIDVPAQIIGDRTMVPARAIAESLGASVDWNPHTRTVIIDD